MTNSINDIYVSEELLLNYFQSLVNRFFKILPIRESEEETLTVYMKSLQCEVLGCRKLISDMNNDSRFFTLAAILQYLIDTPNCPIKDVKREVFKAIRICNQLKEQYREVVET